MYFTCQLFVKTKKEEEAADEKSEDQSRKPDVHRLNVYPNIWALESILAVTEREAEYTLTSQNYHAPRLSSCEPPISVTGLLPDWEEVSAPRENPSRLRENSVLCRGRPLLRFKPGTFILWDNSANHATCFHLNYICISYMWYFVFNISIYKKIENHQLASLN